MVTLSRLLRTSLGEAVQLQREWAVSPPALLPAVPHKPSQSFQAYTGRRRSSAGILLSLEGSERPSVSEIRNRAEVTMKLPLPAASRQWRLYPVSGTELFPAHLHPHSSFQTGAEPCCFLLVDFFSFLAVHFDVPWPPTGRGSAGDSHPLGASVVAGTTSQSPQGGGEQQRLGYAGDTPQDIFHSWYTMVLPFICFLLNTDLLFVKGEKKEKKKETIN